jgi:hypothetical protein
VLEGWDSFPTQETGARMNVYEKLSLAREKFHALKMKKTGYNSFAKYEYFELGDFLIPALTVFKDVGLIGIVSFGKEMADLRIVNMEKPEDQYVINSPMSTAALKGCHEVQNLGAVETYIRRYLWVAALEIVEHDALDATTGKKGDAPTHSPRGGIGDDLSDDDKQFLTEGADYIKACYKDGTDEGKRWYKEQNLEADQETFLFNQLPSDIRTKLKEK